MKSTIIRCKFRDLTSSFDAFPINAQYTNVSAGCWVKNNTSLDIYSDKVGEAGGGKERRGRGLTGWEKKEETHLRDDSLRVAREPKDEVELRRCETHQVAQKADKERSREDCNCVTCPATNWVTREERETTESVHQPSLRHRIAEMKRRDALDKLGKRDRKSTAAVTMTMTASALRPKQNGLDVDRPARARTTAGGYSLLLFFPL